MKKGMDRDETADPNAFLKNYFRLVAGFTGAHGASRSGDDRLHDLSGFVQQATVARPTNPAPTSPLLMKPDRFDMNAYLSASQHHNDVRHQKSLFQSALEVQSQDFLASPNHQQQRRHSLESVAKLPSASSSLISPFAHTATAPTATPSPLPANMTAAQLCRAMWSEIKHRTLRCNLCLKNINLTECVVILQHGKSHCDFESFECLLCRQTSPAITPYRTNKYQVMYGHMKSAHRGRMIMNETWRRLTPAEIAKLDDQLITMASPRASIHDDPEEDRKIRDVIYQCFGEWASLERILEFGKPSLNQEISSMVDGNRRENGNYYYINEKASMGNYLGTTTLALPLASASSFGGTNTNDVLLQGTVSRDQTTSYPYQASHHSAASLLLQQRQSAIVAPTIRRTSANEEFEYRHNDERTALDNLLKAQQQSRKTINTAGQTTTTADVGTDFSTSGSLILDYAKQQGITNPVAAATAAIAGPPSLLMRQNRARKRVSGGSRSLPALETINQLCQQLRNEASYYDGSEQRASSGTGSEGERRPRIWCHLCRKPIELPEAASRYMTEHVASAHTTLKLFCCATCPYEAKTYTQVKAHIKNHHPALATTTPANGNSDEKYTSLKDTFTVKEHAMIPLLKACFMPHHGETTTTTSAATPTCSIGMDMKNGPEIIRVETNSQMAHASFPTNLHKPKPQLKKPGKIRGGLFKCRRCTFTSTSREELARHRRTTWCAYTWPVVHACPICETFTTRYPHILEKHMERLHGYRHNDRQYPKFTSVGVQHGF